VPLRTRSAAGASLAPSAAASDAGSSAARPVLSAKRATSNERAADDVPPCSVTVPRLASSSAAARLSGDAVASESAAAPAARASSTTLPRAAASISSAPRSTTSAAGAYACDARPTTAMISRLAPRTAVAEERSNTVSGAAASASSILSTAYANGGPGNVTRPSAPIGHGPGCAGSASAAGEPPTSALQSTSGASTASACRTPASAEYAACTSARA